MSTLPFKGEFFSMPLGGTKQVPPLWSVKHSCSDLCENNRPENRTICCQLTA